MPRIFSGLQYALIWKIFHNKFSQTMSQQLLGKHVHLKATCKSFIEIENKSLD